MILSLLTYWLAFTFSVLLEKLILFKNIKKAQQKIKQYKTKIIGISGSYGKTSCKNYLYELLVNKYNVLITKSSFNTLNGILITINNYLMPYHDYIILEVGVDKKNGMNKFIKYFNFDITLLTCIGYQHLKTFKNIDNIAKEKLKLLKSCKDICIINEDDKYIKNVDVNCNTIHCSTLVDSDIKITKLSKSKIQIKIYQNIYECNCNLLGSHNLSNLCLCVGVAKALEIDDNKIINQIQKLKNPTHRLSINKFNKWTILDDSYNSNIDGFNSAVQEVSYYNNFKVLITPGIIEKNEMLNNRICNLIDKVNATFDLILLTSNNKDFNNVKNKIVFNSFKDAYNYLQEKYKNEELLVLIENDVPDIFLR